LSGKGRLGLPSRDLVAELKAAGLPAQQGDCDGPLADGISVFDAETEADLDRIVDAARSLERGVLWCGSGGLARRSPTVPSRALEAPVLGLFGSDQSVTANQLAACGSRAVKLNDGERPARPASRMSSGAPASRS
jgi:hypothetical protein